MFKWYGLAGLLLIVFVHVNYALKIEPFASWYFLIVWLGFILVVDAMVYQLSHNSLIMSRNGHLFGMVLVSIAIWWVFELINLRIGNWGYSGYWGGEAIANGIKKTIMYGTMLPAFFETVELYRTFHLFEDKKLKKKHRITKRLLHVMMFVGLACFFLPLLWPTYFFPLVWLTFFLLLDPINYLHGQPSLIQHWKDKRLEIPLVLALAGLTVGFLWEFWNFLAPHSVKWFYNIPYFNFFKIFEMPILGYFGYVFFAFELYAMYFFFRSLFVHKEKLLV